MKPIPRPAKRDLLGMSIENLEEYLDSLGEKRFHARQVAQWIYKKKIFDFSEMSNLSRSLRQKLVEQCFCTRLEPVKRQVSKRDGTAKFLFRCSDGELVETVFLPHEARATACISTQVGCGMGCVFCASSLNGLGRHLSSAEILAQVLGVEEDRKQELDNLVYMGTGEPLHNWEAVAESIRVLTSPKARGWTGRKITISTCGLVPGILKLGASSLSARLAVSLHAFDDRTRSRLMKINEKYPVRDLMAACREYQKQTGLQITFEVILFKGINDSLEHATGLARLVKGLVCKVNLIPYNPVQGLDFQAPDFKTVYAFQTAVKKEGLVVMLRTEKGADIDAACGQLRRKIQDRQ